MILARLPIPRALLAAFFAALLVTVAGAQSLTTTFTRGNGQDGNMFDVSAKRDLTVERFDVHFDVGTWTVEVYYKVGSFRGFEQDPNAWTFLGSVQHVVTTPVGTPQPLALPIGVSMQANDVCGFYVTNDDSTTSGINYTTGSGVFGNSDMEIRDGTGNVYPFGLTFEPRIWNGTVYYSSGVGTIYCVAGTNSTGGVASIGALGSTSVLQNDFVLTVTGSPANRNGLFFYGKGKTQIPFANGFLCIPPLGGNLKRTGAIQSADPAGEVLFALDLSTRPLLAAGTRWNFQYWYRDPAGGGQHDTNLSDALNVRFSP